MTAMTMTGVAATASAAMAMTVIAATIVAVLPAVALDKTISTLVQKTWMSPSAANGRLR